MTTQKNLLSAVQQAVTDYCEATLPVRFDPEHPVVRLHEATFAADEINAAVECLLTTYVTMGPKVKAFERAFADKYGYKHAVMVNSGSSANLLAVAAVANVVTTNALKPGDEVIVPALSWSTTVWPLVQLGLVPVIVDIDPGTFNIDPVEIEKAISPKTRAIMLVHVYGNMCDMDAIGAICERHGLMLIEDACEAQGATWRDKPAGSWGRVSTFSFYYSHHMTTLEGGMCVTNDDELAETMRILRAHGWVREVEDRQKWLDLHPGIDPRFLFVNVGYNLRATELQGAMGLVQLPKVDDFIATRREAAAQYRRDIAQFSDIFEMLDEAEHGHCVYLGFPLRLKAEAPFALRELTDALNAAGVETRPIICGNIAKQPAMKLFEHRTVGDLPVASAVMTQGFSFGCHQGVDMAAVAHVTGTIRSFLRARNLI